MHTLRPPNAKPNESADYYGFNPAAAHPTITFERLDRKPHSGHKPLY